MSNSNEPPSQRAESHVISKENRTKKEKRNKSSQVTEKTAMSDTPETPRNEKHAKKEKKTKTRPASEDKDEAVNGSEDEIENQPMSTKKRKREALPDELEIDISLPEPASKKAARKAKKAKSAPTAPTDDTTVPVISDKHTDASGKRSEYGVWIGNLPWSTTRDLLIDFLTSNSDITTKEITRVHLPPPTKPPNPNWTFKPLNKGFAYVDFSTQLAMYSAIALTETKVDGRALLIKNAKSFEGRPEKAKEAEVGPDGKVKAGHAPNKRVFVGNLAFDVSKEDLQAHYEQCGEILDIHMATFEDSGKCKGYAWVTFDGVEAATSAVKGYIFKDEKDINKDKKKQDENADGDAEIRESKKKEKKEKKKRKWLVNKLMGRDLRCEFAEDSTVRYNKRHGKPKTDPADLPGVHPDRVQQFDGDAPNERPPRVNRPFKPRQKFDARTIPSGKAHTMAPRASHAIVEATGKKTALG